jgi:hypothetical protein
MMHSGGKSTAAQFFMACIQAARGLCGPGTSEGCWRIRTGLFLFEKELL